MGFFDFSDLEEESVEDKARNKSLALPYIAEKKKIAFMPDADTLRFEGDDISSRVLGYDSPESKMETLADISAKKRGRQEQWGRDTGIGAGHENLVQAGIDAKDKFQTALGDDEVWVSETGIKSGLKGDKRPIVRVYNSKGDDVGELMNTAETNVDYYSTWNAWKREKDEKAHLENAKVQGEDNPTGFGPDGKPQIQLKKDGSYAYGGHSGLTGEGVGAIDERVQAEYASRNSWVDGGGPVNWLADLVTGAGALLDSAVIQPTIERVIHAGPRDLDEAKETFNKPTDMEEATPIEDPMTDADIDLFRKGDEKFLQTYKGKFLTNAEENMDQRAEAVKALKEQQEIDRSRVYSVDRAATDKRVSAVFEESGFIAGMVEGAKNIGDYTSRMAGSLPQMLALANPWTTLPAIAGMLSTAENDNYSEFVKLNNRLPDKSERNWIRFGSALQVGGEKLEATYLLGAGKNFKLIGTLAKKFAKMPSSLNFLVGNVGKGLETVIAEGISGGMTSFGEEFAVKQDWEKVDKTKVFEGIVAEAYGGLGFQSIRSAAVGSKGVMKKTAKAAVKKAEKTTAARATVTADTESVVGPTPTAAPEQTTYTKVSDRFAKAENMSDFVASAINDMTGATAGDKGQAAYDLVMAIATGDTGENSQEVADILKTYGKDIIAASDQLTQMTESIDANMDVSFGSLGETGKDNTTGLKTQEGVTEAEIQAVEAIDKIVASKSDTELARVGREVLEDNAETKNVGVKTYLKKALETGTVPAAMKKFAVHMQKKAASFVEAQKAGGAFVPKGTKEYGLKTEQDLIDAGIKFEQKGNFKVFEGYNWVGQNESSFSRNVKADAELVQSFLTLAEAVVVGKKQRDIAGKLAGDLKQKVIKAGGKDTSGPKQKEKKQRKKEAAEEKVDTKRAETAKKPTPQPTPKPDTVAEAAKRAGATGVGTKDQRETPPPIEETLPPSEAYENEDSEAPKDLNEETVQVKPYVNEESLGGIVGTKKHTGETVDKVVAEVLAGGKEIALGLVKDDLVQEFGETGAAKIWSARKQQLSWIERIKENFVELRGFADGNIGKVLQHFGFANASVINLLEDKFDGKMMAAAIDKLSGKSDAGKRDALVQLFEGFRDAGGNYIDKNELLNKLEYSFNNLFTQKDKYSEKEISDQFYYAMANVFAGWMNSSGKKTLFNDKHDISKILYGEFEHSLTGQEQKAISGIGTPLYMVAGELGREMAKILGLKVMDPSKKTGHDAQDFADFGMLSDQDSFERSLGLMLLDLAENVQFNGQKIVQVKQNKNIQLGKNSTANNVRKDGTIDLNTIQILNKKNPLIKLFRKADKFFGSINGVQFDKSDIYPDGPKTSIIKKIAGSFSELPKNRQDVLKKLQNVEWRPIAKNIEVFLGLSREQQLKMAGWRTTKGVHVDKVDAVAAKNLQVEGQVDSLAALDKKNGFWFGYYMMNQFRIMIDSNGVNPLSGKNLHRFMVNPAGSEVTFTRGDAKLEDMFKYSISQALGNDIDKTDHAGVLEDFEKVVAKYGQLAKSMNNDEISERIGSAHELAGLIALQDWVNGKDQITTNLGVEVDGITNGYALGLMQFPNNDDGKLWGNLERVGITDKKGKYEGGIDSVVDAYITAGTAFGEALREIGLKDVFESVAGSISRDLMKNPFMIFNYGASAYKAAEGVISSPYGVGIIDVIYKKLGELDGPERVKYIDDVRTLMEKTASRDKEGNIYSKAQANIDQVVARLRATTKSGFATQTIETEMELLKEIVNSGLTDVIDQAFEPLVGSTKMIKGKLSQAMDAIASGFADEFAIAKQEYLGKLQFHGTKKDDGSPIKTRLTQKEMLDVAKTLVDTHYPFLEGAWNESTEGDQQAFIDMVSKERTDTREQVKNGMLTKGTVVELKKRLKTKVDALNRATGKKTQAKDIVSFLKDNGVNIKDTQWSVIAYSSDFKTGKNIDVKKVFDAYLKDQTEVMVPRESTVPLGSFGYGHPGAKMIVRSIQNADAAAMGKTIADTDHGFLGLHDAIYMTIADIQAGVKTINDNASETMKKYSIAEAVLTQLKKVHENIKMMDRRLSDKVGDMVKLEEVRSSLGQINRANGKISNNNTRIAKLQDQYEAGSRINRIAKKDKATEKSILARQERDLLEIDKKIVALEDGIVWYEKEIERLEKLVARNLGLTVVNSKKFLEGLKQEINEKAQKNNMTFWNRGYEETSKEFEDHRKNPDKEVVYPSDKLKELVKIVAKNTEDRKKFFEILKNGEIVQYYMPGGVDNRGESFGSTGDTGSTQQDTRQEAIQDEFIGTSTAADVSRINTRFGGKNSNKDVDRVIEKLIGPLMEKIGALTIDIRKIGDGYAEGLYTAGTNTIDMIYNSKGPESRTEQTEQEVFGHELVHAVAWKAVQNSQKFRTELARLRDSIRSKVSVSDFIVDDNPSEHAKKMAELQYRAVFGSKTGGTKGLHEFLAYGLTNPVLVEKLKGLVAQRAGWFEGNTWYEKVVSALVKAIEVIEYMINKTNDKNAYEQLFRLTQEINGINQSKTSKLASMFNADKIYGTSDTWLRGFVDKNKGYAQGIVSILARKNAVMLQQVEKKLPKFTGERNQILGSLGSAGVMSVGVVRHVSAIVAMATDKDVLTQEQREQWMLNVMEASTDWVNERETQIARTIVNAMTGIVKRTPLEIQRLISKSHAMIEGARKANKEMVEALVVNGFKGSRIPTKKESRMLTKVIGKADLQALLEVMDPKEILELVTDDAKLDALINSEMHGLRAEGMDVWWWKQAQGLSNRMVDQTTGFGFVFDNVYVAEKHAKQQLGDIERFNRYVSLLALKKTSGRNTLTNLITESSAGVESLLGTFKSLDIRSQRDAFGGNRFLMTKGYIARIADPHKKVETAGADQVTRDQMKLRGFEFQYNLPNSTEAIYLAENLPVESQTKGLMSKTAKHMAHTSVLKDFESKWINDPNVDRAENYHNKKAATRAFLKKLIRDEQGPAQQGARPIVNERGEVVDFTIDMNFHEEEKLLGLNMDVAQVAGTIQSRITDKVNTETINADGVEVLIKRSEDHYQDQPWEFVNLLDQSSDLYNKHFTRLPYEARKAIERYAADHNGEFFIEEVWLDQIFGHENWSVKNLFTNEKTKRSAAVIEEVVKEIVGIINNNIVIKTPAVWGGNFASNFVTSIVSGLGVIETIKYWKEGLSELRKYQKDAEALNQLDFQAEASIAYKKANAARRQKLVDRMNSNPTKELVDDGLYNAITTEAVGTDEYSYKNKAVRFYEDKVKNVPGAEGITNIAKGLYMAEDTSAYKSLLGMVQVSDFLGRYGIYKKMTQEQGKSKDEAYSYIQDMFVDFNLPTSAALQYANSMGMVLFYKYWSRIQRATLGMIKHHPTKSMQTLLMRSMLGMDIATIFNSGIITGGNFSPMSAWLRPGEMAQQFLMPSGVEIGMNFSDGIIGLAGAVGTGAAIYEGAKKDNELFGFNFGSGRFAGSKVP